MRLFDKKHAAREGKIQLLGKTRIKTLLAQLKSKWEIADWKKIKKEFKFTDFKEAMRFVNKVAKLAQAQNHHPDIYIFYNKVVIELWTHAASGLSENDFILAAKIEKLEIN